MDLFIVIQVLTPFLSLPSALLDEEPNGDEDEQHSSKDTYGDPGLGSTTRARVG